MRTSINLDNFIYVLQGTPDIILDYTDSKRLNDIIVKLHNIHYAMK